MRFSLRLYWLLLCVMGLMLILSPGTVLAQEEKIDLILRLIPGDYYKKVTPGEENILYLEIHNAGNKPITNIRLSSDEPEGWVVKFRPMSIDYLGAGSHQAIDVNVVVAPDTDKGKYTLTMIAEADQTRTVTSTVLRVENAFSLWQWVGLGMGALVIAGFAMVYRRFGRE